MCASNDDDDDDDRGNNVAATRRDPTTWTTTTTRTACDDVASRSSKDGVGRSLRVVRAVLVAWMACNSIAGGVGLLICGGRTRLDAVLADDDRSCGLSSTWREDACRRVALVLRRTRPYRRPTRNLLPLRSRTTSDEGDDDDDEDDESKDESKDEPRPLFGVFGWASSAVFHEDARNPLQGVYGWIDPGAFLDPGDATTNFEFDLDWTNLHNDVAEWCDALLRGLSDWFANVLSFDLDDDSTERTRTTTPRYYEEPTDAQVRLAARLAAEVRASIGQPREVLDARLESVRWGGPGGPRWWVTKDVPRHRGADAPPDPDGDGVRLMIPYLKIMNFNEDLRAVFPFELCARGCPSTFAVRHSLEYRERYKPWLVAESSIRENRRGFVYVRGRSPDGGPDQPGPSLVFLRPGLHPVENREAYIRALINALETAVADALRRSKGKHGEFNVLLDSAGFSLQCVGAGPVDVMINVRQTFRILKDHFPDQCGHVYLVNLGGPASLFLRMVWPFLAQEFREKIHVVPDDDRGRQRALAPLLGGEDKVPHWLGGKDDYEFDVDDYYRNNDRYKGNIVSEEIAAEYQTTMPYHSRAAFL